MTLPTPEEQGNTAGDCESYADVIRRDRRCVAKELREIVKVSDSHQLRELIEQLEDGEKVTND